MLQKEDSEYREILKRKQEKEKIVDEFFKNKPDRGMTLEMLHMV